MFLQLNLQWLTFIKKLNFWCFFHPFCYLDYTNALSSFVLFIHWNIWLIKRLKQKKVEPSLSQSLVPSFRLNWLYCSHLVKGTLMVYQFSSVARSRLTPWTVARQASVSITNSWAYSNSCPLSQWCHPAISSSDGVYSSLKIVSIRHPTVPTVI